MNISPNTGSQALAPLALIADDDATVRTIMREVLEQAGFRVEEAADGQLALDQFEQLSPDVVLLDVEMPNMDGYTVCKRIRAQESLRATPIFIITGRDDPQSIQHAYDIGATDFLSKPIPWTILAHRVRFVLRASDAVNEIQGLVRAMPDKIFVLNEEGELLARSDEARSGQPTVAELISSDDFSEVFPEHTRADVKEKVAVALTTGKPQIHEHAIDNGGKFLETRIVGRDRSTALAIVRNVTGRKEYEDRVYDLAYYDQLTGLPNRQLFQQSLDEAIKKAERRANPFAILFVDLDRFKRINDTLGHSMGDALLRSVADRLRECTGADEKDSGVEIARLGGDEFVVMLGGMDCAFSASAMADKVVTSLSRPMECEGHRLVVTPSIGITMYPQDGNSSESLLMNADSAMYRAKSAGRNTHKFYSDTMRIRSLHRLDIENELRDAIHSNQFSLHYQPKVDLKTWSVVGLEALIRWKHPERGWISPGEFIPIAEESGLIVPIGTWVLQEACRQIRQWRNTALHDVRVSVNISSEQIYTDNLMQTVIDAMAKNQVGAESLELEITESLLMRDIDSTVETLNQFKELGLAISIDDFGTGYSSLSYLTRFPIDTLKIDQSFVRDLHIDSDDAAICAAILAMARKLNLNVVAEGVEIDEQLQFLRSHACNQIQGYLYSKPLPPDELEELIAAKVAKAAFA
jgi:diguanylate cyclase (GGDEF)-like protein